MSGVSLTRWPRCECMKIALVLDDTLDTPDGVQQVILQIGRELTSRGHEVHYLTSTTTRRDLPNVHSLAGNLRLRFNGNRIGIPLPANRRRVRELLAEQEFDLVHVSAPYSPLLAGRVVTALPAGTPLVATFMILPLGPVSRWGGKVLGLLQRRQARRFQRFMAVSEPAREFSAFMYGDPGVTTGNPVDVAPFLAARERAVQDPLPGPVRILFLGRLVERKGAGALLRAVRILKGLTDVPFSVEIAGRGPLLEQYRRYVRDNGLTEQVTFSGFVAEERKADLLAEAHIIALPAFGGESFGISVVEALAAGTGAVLAGDNPGYASTLGPLTECLVDPSDDVSFAARLQELIEDPHLRGRMSARQSEQARLFDTPLVVDRIEEVYAEASAGRLSTTRSSR